MFNKTLTVEELNGYVHSIFVAEEMLHGVSVFGEISGFKISGAHAYFTIKGKDAAIPCNLFNYRKTYLPKDGESVIVKGTPDFYVKTGKLSFNVQTVQPVGVGDLHKQMEALKAALAEEGVFSPEHKKPIPAFPRDVCVITSKTGAVIRDICRTVRLVNQSLNIHVYNARVQGEGAENEIAEGIKRVDGKYDVIIVARGGGSFEDLAPFNTEALARTIYAADTPIISAVGHETDFTICDFAADARAATPTAAAHMVAFDENAIKTALFDTLSKIGLRLQDRLREQGKEISVLVKSINGAASLLTERAIARWRVSSEKLLSASRAFMTNKDNLLDKTLVAYAAVNPLNSLNKGFFSATKDGKRISSVHDARVGDDLTLRAKDGKIITTVKEIKYDV